MHPLRQLDAHSLTGESPILAAVSVSFADPLPIYKPLEELTLCFGSGRNQARWRPLLQSSDTTLAETSGRMCAIDGPVFGKPPYDGRSATIEPERERRDRRGSQFNPNRVGGFKSLSSNWSV
jgi:hypothetical protein